ncbi:MAG: cytochrome c3 family protein [Bacteroidales bacterium]|nr:cytochrome c3 family protein [Bacteroidales bacterium]
MKNKNAIIIRQIIYSLSIVFIFVLFIKASFPEFVNLHNLNNYVRQVLDLPHGGCSSCHIFHNASGAQLGMVNGNANLCMSCHNPLGTANQKPFTNADKAIPGVTGTSHAWNVNAVNNEFEVNMTSNTQMALRVVNDTIICSTCHDQHSQDFPPFLRATNTADALCKDCHSARNVGVYSSDPINNKGSHPVGVLYNTADSRFETTPLNPDILIVDSNVECSSCHQVHYANTNDGYLLRATNDDNLCQSCHTYGAHEGMGCSVCHQTHNRNKANIFMIRDTIQTPNSGARAVAFFAQTGTNSFADNDANYNGICEVCHTSTDFHRNNSSGDHNHNNELKCTSCHTHKDAFQVNCTSCHGSPPNGSTSPNLAGSHATHYAPTSFGPELNACEDCHLFSGATHNNGVVDFIDSTQLAATHVCDNCHSPGGAFDGVNNPNYGAKSNWNNGVYTADTLMAGKENWCAGCHDASPASSNLDGTGVLAPDVAGDLTSYGYYYSGHGKNNVVNCLACHDATANHIDGEPRSYAYSQAIANQTGTEYRIGYRLKLINGMEPMRIPLNDTSILQADAANFRLCADCHSWNDLSNTNLPYATNFNHSGANAGYSYGYDVSANMNNHINNHMDMQAHYGPQPFWDSDWDFNTTADQVTNLPEINGYDSFITCVTCHDVHGGRAFGGNTEGNMMRDGRLQNREPGLKFTYLIEAPGGFPFVTSVGANKLNSIGGVVRSGIDYRAGYNGTEPNAICGGCHGEVYPSTDEYDATGTAGNSCLECHMMGPASGYYIEYFRTFSN